MTISCLEKSCEEGPPFADARRYSQPVIGTFGSARRFSHQGQVASFPPPSLRSPLSHAARAVQTLLELPDQVGLVSFRELAPVIGQLRNRYDLNILGMEVLAAAVHLQADVYISAPSPRLQDALTRESRRVEVVV